MTSGPGVAQFDLLGCLYDSSFGFVSSLAKFITPAWVHFLRVLQLPHKVQKHTRG